MQAVAPQRSNTITWVVALAALVAATVLIGTLARGGADSGPSTADVESSSPNTIAPSTSNQVPATTNQSTSPDAPVAADAGTLTLPSESILVDPGTGVTIDESRLNAACSGLVQFGTFMEFGGVRYALSGTGCDAGVAPTQVGTTAQIDVEHSGPVTVYQGADGMLYTKDADGTWMQWSGVER